MDGDGGGFSIFVRRLSGTGLIFVWYYLYRGIENIFFLSRVSMNISKRERLRRIIVLVGKRE